MAYNKKNYIKKAQMIATLAYQYYEPGRQDRSLQAVWRRWIVEVYPMSYQTFLRYLASARTAENQTTDTQQKLF